MHWFFIFGAFRNFYLVEASDTVILGIFNCCLKFLLYSNNRASFASEIFDVFRAILLVILQSKRRGKEENRRTGEKGQTEKLFSFQCGEKLRLFFTSPMYVLVQQYQAQNYLSGSWPFNWIEIGKNHHFSWQFHMNPAYFVSLKYVHPSLIFHLLVWQDIEEV